MSFISLKTAIKNRLLNITEIEEVKDYPSQDFTNFPSAVVRSNGVLNDYETNKENLETYQFTIFVFYSYQAESDNEADIRERLETLCDTIRDDFDDNEFLNGISLPADRVMIGIYPTSAVIGEYDNGKYIGCEIEIDTRISKTNS